MRNLARIVLAILVAAPVLLGIAAAQPFGARPPGRVPDGTRERVQSGEVRPLNDILDSVRRQRPGYLADVDGPHADPSGDPHYRLKWVSPNGRVEWLDTDARTGRILGGAGPQRGPLPFAGPVGRVPPPPGAMGLAPRRPNRFPGRR